MRHLRPPVSRTAQEALGLVRDATAQTLCTCAITRQRQLGLMLLQSVNSLVPASMTHFMRCLAASGRGFQRMSMMEMDLIPGQSTSGRAQAGWLSMIRLRQHVQGA